jgi:uncharacterized lipoprotein YddW (UPF0748 family)
MLKINFLMAAVLLCALLGLQTHVSAQQTAPVENQSRALFDEGFTWLTRSGAEETLQKMKEAGFNVYVPCIWHGRGVTWESALVRRDPRWTDKHPGNPLGYLISRAHELGIEVHPWFTVVRREDGILPQWAPDGTPQDAFNAHDEGFQKFMDSLISEVVQKYEIDGINLDYMRTMGVCTAPACQLGYNEFTGRDLMVDLNESSRDSSERIRRWNGKAITALLVEISSQIREHKPEVVISVDSHAGEDWVSREGAEAIKWANSGLVDVIYDMDYSPSVDVNAHRKVRHSLDDPDMAVLLVGNFGVRPGAKRPWGMRDVFPQEPEIVVNALRTAQALGSYNGVGLYELRFLTPSQRKNIKAGPFRDLAKPRWKLHFDK